MKKLVGFIIVAFASFFILSSTAVEVDANFDYRSNCRIAYDNGYRGYYTVTVGKEKYLCFNSTQSGDKIFTDNNGKLLAFDSNGKNVKNSWYRDILSYTYRADENGYLVSGKWLVVDGSWYYFDYDGKMYENGIRSIDGNNYYFYPSGRMSYNEWISNNGKWYHSNDSGTLAKGWKLISGSWYYFDSSYYGEMVSNTFRDIAGDEYYFTSSGRMATNSWHKYGNFGWKYFKSDGRSARGWFKPGGKWAYFNSLGAYENEIRYIGGKLYAFDSKSYMISNDWYEDGSDWYYLSDNGMALKNSWKKLGDKWYYFDFSSVMLKNTSEMIGSYTYAFSGNGVMLTNRWYKDYYGSWYYLNSNGKSHKGWKKMGGKWYYFDQYDGEMYANVSRYIDGKYYSFNSSGHMK